MLPRLKSFRTVSRDGAFVVRPDIGIELRIDDPEGQVAHLCSLLDGARSPEGVHAGMSQRWPDLTLEDVLAGIEDLGAAGLIEDAARATSDVPSIRYAGNIAFFEAFDTLQLNRFEMQRRLSESHVLLLGVGGVGGSLLMNLAGQGVGRITAVDFDAVDLSNLNRQFLFAERDITRNKLDAAAEWVRGFNGDVEVAAVSRRITSSSDVAALLCDVDLVLMAIDEPPVEVDRWVNEACVAARIPFVAGGLRSQRALYFSVDPGESGCMECAAFLQEPVPTGQTGGAAASLAPVVMLVAGLMSLEATRYLSGFARPVAAGKVWLVDLESGRTDVAFEWPRNPACEQCGRDPVRPDLVGAAHTGEAS